VRFLQSYGPDHLPEEGDVVWAQHYGTDFMVFAQHVVLNGTVTL
jgi:hypothetical protein